MSVTAAHCRLSMILILLFLLITFSPHLTPATIHAQDADTDQWFAEFYWRHHGIHTLGRVHTPILEVDGVRVQYFDQGRLEDHRHLTSNPAEAVGHTPLTHMLMADAPWMRINGLPVTYGMLREQAGATIPAPEGFVGGTLALQDHIFVPANYELTPGPGYLVPHQFWTYMNRTSLFPGGWMHGVGLPLTQPFEVMVATADGERSLVVQAFDRTVLLLDLAEQYDWAVRRAHIGTDATWLYYGEPLAAAYPAAPPDLYPDAPKRIEVDLQRQWLWAYQGDALVMDAPVSTGKDGFETPPGRWRIYDRYRLRRLRGSYRGEMWDVPNVPAVMFYWGGFAIHGVYWHDRFGTGERHSHGCVGLAPHDAYWLFDWAPIGTQVIVR